MLFLSFSSKDNGNVWHKNSDFPCLSTFQQQTMTLLPLLTITAHGMWSSNLKESQAVRVLIIVERPLALYAQKTPAPIRQVYTVCQCMKEERTGPVFCINNGHAPLLLDQCASGLDLEAAAMAEMDRWDVDREGNEQSSRKWEAVTVDYKLVKAAQLMFSE